MFDIITFGSAIQDIFVKPGKYKVLKSSKDFATGKGVCFSLGSKIEIQDMQFFSGGGGTNTAVGFARQGFKTAYCGAVGNDISGIAIIDELSRKDVAVNFIKKVLEKSTSHSIIMTGLGGERTILVYRGASEMFCKEDINWQEIKETKWFYLAPLSGKLCENFEELVNFAKANSIKIAANLGNSQLLLPKSELKNILENIDILILNQEEASLLTKIPFAKEKEIFKKIDKICPGIAIMTKGKDGVVVSDGKFLYSAKPDLKAKVVDTTGAGDSFASGFVSAFIKESGDIEKSIQLGLANSQACLSAMGAKNGLLKTGDNFTKVEIKKTKI